MLTLYHTSLSPFCRKVRLVLAEKKLETTLVEEKPWERRLEFMAMNPAVEVPVLKDTDGTIISDSTAIVEYLEEVYPDTALMPKTPKDRAEVRRLMAWFDIKFAREVSRNLLFEKVGKRTRREGTPNSQNIKTGTQKIKDHMEYIDWLMERRSWLAGETLTLADFTAAAHISSIDYIGDVPWSGFEGAKIWYAKIKSRPAFRTLLTDHITGLPASATYADLDF